MRVREEEAEGAAMGAAGRRRDLARKTARGKHRVSKCAKHGKGTGWTDLVEAAT